MQRYPVDKVGHASSWLGLDHVDHAPPAALAKLYRASDQGKQCVIAAAANAVTRMKMRAALPDENLASLDNLPAITFDA
jgi:hypothetical protein